MATKRILLMYITEISGHHSATLAIEQALKLISPQVKVLNINAFHYTHPISEKIVNHLYLNVVQKTPKIWDYLYDNPHVARRLERMKKVLHRFNLSKLKRLFSDFKPQVVACTQAFPCGMVADYKKEFNSSLPLVAVLTDYIPHTYWIYDTVNYYICPSEEVAKRLNQKGVAQEKIKPFGIPFDPKFNLPLDKEKIKLNLGLDLNSKVILIMGGGHGLGPIKTILKYLEKLKKDFTIMVVAGSNHKLYKSLKEKIKKYKKKLLIFGFVDNIHELMAISDILITKPGGITVSEALAKKIPLVIIHPLPGQEVNNANYLVEKKAALKVDKVEEIGLVIDELLSQPEQLKNLAEAAERISKPNASFEIAKLLLDLCALRDV